jgi:hypothetical protein
MTADEVIRGFAGLPPQKQAHVLARLALDLTIHARCAYPGQVDERVAAGKLSAFNELQHTVAGHLTHLTAGDVRRYPDEVLVAILFDKARAGQCERDLAEAFERSLRVT